MDRDVYDKKWKLGPFAKKKEELKQGGKLDKYGRIVDSTPEAWKMLFGDAEKATNIHEVAAAVQGKPAEAKATPIVAADKAESSDDEVAEKKRDKKKKEKKDKKEKKSKKSKKEESD